MQFLKAKLEYKSNTKVVRVDRMFDSDAWSLTNQGGHRKFKHRLLGTVIEYAAHHKDLDPGAVASIRETLQVFVNVLGNDIFEYKLYNWVKRPDFNQATANIQRLLQKT